MIRRQYWLVGFALSFSVALLANLGRTAPAVQDWVGEYVVPRNPDVRLTIMVEDEKPVPIETGDNALRVVKDAGETLHFRWGGKNATGKRRDWILVKDADTFFTQEIAADNNDPWPWSIRAESRRVRYQYAKAIKDYTELVRLEPKNPYWLQQRGNAYTVLHQNDKALLDFNNGLALEDEDPDLLSNRAYIYTRQGEFAKAQADLDLAFKIEGRATTLERRGDLWLAQGNLEKAFLEYEKSLELDPENPYPHIGRAYLYQLKKDLPKALESANKAIELAPYEASGLTRRSAIYSEMKDYKLALADAVAACKLAPHDAHQLLNRGGVYSLMGNAAKATADYDEALKLSPEELEPRNAKAWLQSTCPDAKFRDGALALKVALEVCEQSSYREPNFIDTLAAAYAETGDFEKALKFQRLANTFPEFRLSYGDDSAKHLAAYEKNKPYREPAE